MVHNTMECQHLFYNMARKTVGLVGMWDCVAFGEVAGITFKHKDGIQIMKDYMASGSFARGKEEKAASASMVFVGNINQSEMYYLKLRTYFILFQKQWHMIQHFLIECIVMCLDGRFLNIDQIFLPMNMDLLRTIYQKS